MGVVHRDIKPGNLMLDNASHLWITDFGLAKSLSPGREPGDLTLTGDLIGTLRYMSPEQALAKHGLVDHRTDIYSLGATLYELLTLKPAVPGNDKAEILKRIAFEEPTPLRKLDKSIPAELETITLKCMAKEPGERYATAGEVADDLRRWLGDQTIKAKPPGWREKAAKWGRRHRVLVQSTAAILVVSVIGLGVGAWIIWREQQATWQAKKNADFAGQNALQQAAIARAINDFLQQDLLRQADISVQVGGGFVGDANLTVKEALNRAARSIESRFQNQPLVEAGIRHAIGSAYVGVGDAQTGVVHLERAVELRKQELGIDDEITLISMHDLAWGYRHAGRTQDAIRLNEYVRDRLTVVFGAEHPHTLNTLNNLGVAYNAAGRVTEAIRIHEQNREAHNRSAGSDPAKIADNLRNLAFLYRQTHKPREAIKLLEQLRQDEANRPGPPSVGQMMTLYDLALSYADAGQLADASRLHEETLAIRKLLLGPDHSATLDSMDRVASSYRALGRNGDAITLFRELLELKKAKFGADASGTLSTMSNLALACKDAGQFLEAIALYEQVRDAGTKKLGPRDTVVLSASHNLGAAYLRVGRATDAVALLEQLREPLVNTLGPDHPDTLMFLNTLAQAYGMTGRRGEAISQLQQLNKTMTERFGADHPRTMPITHNLGKFHSDADEYDQALGLLEPLRERAARKLGPEHPNALMVLHTIAEVYQNVGRLDEAIELAQQATERMTKAIGPNHANTRAALNILVEALFKAGQFDRSESAARDLLNRVPRTDRSLRAAALSSLGRSLISQKKSEEAETLLRECLDIRMQLHPNDLRTSIARSLLGAALVGQNKHAEAEPLLISGFEGMKQQEAKIRIQFRDNLVFALEQLVALYVQTGNEDKAAHWRQKLDAQRAALKPKNK
jgi:tetratricopeptide (TPR) repeat protein